jgi:hypothetical protein
MPLTIDAALNEIQDILERQKSSKAQNNPQAMGQ